MKYWYDKDSKETSRYVESCDKGASHGFLTTFTEEEPGADGTTFGTRCESQDFIQICQDTWKALDYNLLEGASDEAIAKWEFTPPSDDQDADGYYTAFFMEWVLPLEQTLIHEVWKLPCLILVLSGPCPNIPSNVVCTLCRWGRSARRR